VSLGEQCLRLQRSPAEHFNYLTCLARNRADVWLCQKCVKLHPVNIRDIPGRQVQLDCAPKYVGGCQDPTAQCPAHISLHHPHIQLALKLTRLRTRKRKYKKYLAHLLGPRYCTIRPGPEEEGKVIPTVTVYPKIVTERLLLKVDYQYDAGQKTLSSYTMARMYTCQHQMSHPDKLRCFGDGQSLWSVINGAFTRDGVHQHEFCYFCPTDFTVRATSSRVSVSVWIDLGPEGTPLDPTWKMRVQSSTGDYRHLVYKDPGKIRGMYESGPAIKKLPVPRPLNDRWAVTDKEAKDTLDQVVMMSAGACAAACAACS
jgi:hypothetical protein